MGGGALPNVTMPRPAVGKLALGKQPHGLDTIRPRHGVIRAVDKLHVERLGGRREPRRTDLGRRLDLPQGRSLAG